MRNKTTLYQHKQGAPCHQGVAYISIRSFVSCNKSFYNAYFNDGVHPRLAKECVLHSNVYNLYHSSTELGDLKVRIGRLFR